MTEYSLLRAGQILNDQEKMLVRESGLEVNYLKGHILYSAHDGSDRVWLIESGWVKIYKISMDGKRVAVGGIRGPGEIVGLSEALLGIERTCYASAINKVSAVILTKDTFAELMKKNMMLAEKVTKLLSARMREAEAKLHEMVCWQASGRLAHALIKMGECAGERTPGGVKINLRLTHEDLASMVGASRQTVTLFLNTFKQEKSIAYDGGAMQIQPDKLAKWLA